MQVIYFVAIALCIAWGILIYVFYNIWQHYQGKITLPSETPLDPMVEINRKLKMIYHIPRLKRLDRGYTEAEIDLIYKIWYTDEPIMNKSEEEFIARWQDIFKYSPETIKDIHKEWKKIKKYKRI